jgi:DNA repair protein RadC
LKQLEFWTPDKPRAAELGAVVYARRIPTRDAPQHRLQEVGPAALSDVEVLAAILGGKPEDALEIARHFLSEFGGFQGLLRTSITEMARVRGVGRARAVALKAALELGRRLLLAPADERICVRSPADVAALLMAEMSHLVQEQLRVLLLDNRLRLIRQVLSYQGTINTSIVRVAEVFREPVREGCKAIILCHAHPSGDPSPSPEDIAITKECVEAGRLLGIDVTDHLIIGQGRYVSLRERGLGFS